MNTPSNTPQYGDFGHATPTNSTPKSNDNSGHNDNPDEFSEFRDDNATGSEDYSPEAEAADPRDQKGHVEQNQAPDAVRATQNADAEDQQDAWAKDDPRYAGGHRRQGYDDDPTHVL